MSNAVILRRAVAAAALCAAFSVTSAHANATVTFKDLKPNGHARSKSQKLADGAACGTSGPTHTLRVTPPVFVKCMRAKGWVLDHYAPDPAVPVHGKVEDYADTKGDAHGHPRGTAALHADERACKARGSRSTKQCLAARGWQLMLTRHGPAPHRPVRYARPAQPSTWIDPDTGLTCHSEGIAQICSNY
jgi:hypothetical protein